MQNINLSKILSDPGLLAAFLISSVRTFFVEKGAETLTENIRSVSLRHTTLSIVTESPLVAHDMRLYQVDLKNHLQAALARIGHTASFRLIIK